MFASRALTADSESNVGAFRDQTVYKKTDFQTFLQVNDHLIYAKDFTIIDSETFRAWTKKERENVLIAILIEFDTVTNNVTSSQDVTIALTSEKFPEYYDRLLPFNGRALYIQNRQGGNAYLF